MIMVICGAWFRESHLVLQVDLVAIVCSDHERLDACDRDRGIECAASMGYLERDRCHQCRQ